MHRGMKMIAALVCSLSIATLAALPAAAAPAAPEGAGTTLFSDVWAAVARLISPLWSGGPAAIRDGGPVVTGADGNGTTDGRPTLDPNG
jgi:hypothetical protein